MPGITQLVTTLLGPLVPDALRAYTRYLQPRPPGTADVHASAAVRRAALGQRGRTEVGDRGIRGAAVDRLREPVVGDRRRSGLDGHDPRQRHRTRAGTGDDHQRARRRRRRHRARRGNADETHQRHHRHEHGKSQPRRSGPLRHPASTTLRARPTAARDRIYMSGVRSVSAIRELRARARRRLRRAPTVAARKNRPASSASVTPIPNFTT